MIGQMYDGPKSICTCEHEGDGNASQHANNAQKGHGACLVKDCPCLKFSWKRFTDAFQAFMDKHS
jgi:hypothetical protein